MNHGVRAQLWVSVMSVPESPIDSVDVIIGHLHHYTIVRCALRPSFDGACEFKRIPGTG